MQPLRDVRIRALLERQPDIQADGLAAALPRAAIRRLHDAGAAAGRDDKAVILGLQAQGPRREQPGQLARVLVIARPFEGAADLVQLLDVLLVGVAHAACAQRPQRQLRALAAGDARRSEEHDGILDLLLPETPERLEVLRKNPNGPRFGAFEELGIEVRERLLRHTGQCTTRML